MTVSMEAKTAAPGSGDACTGAFTLTGAGGDPAEHPLPAGRGSYYADAEDARASTGDPTHGAARSATRSQLTTARRPPRGSADAVEHRVAGPGAELEGARRTGEADGRAGRGSRPRGLPAVVTSYRPGPCRRSSGVSVSTSSRTARPVAVS